MKTVTKVNKPKSNAEIGERIKYLRCNLLMSQEDLAKKVGRKREEITMFEKGTRCIDVYTLKDIARVFNVSTDYLLGLSNFENANADRIAINELTGLSDNAINNLINIKKYHSQSIIDTINYLLEQEKYCPNEYYELKPNEKITDKQEQILTRAWKNWEEKNYKTIFTNISNYFNVKVDSKEKIHLKSNLNELEKEIAKKHNTLSNEIISNQDLADTIMLKKIEKLFEDAKKDYLMQSERNEK